MSRWFGNDAIDIFVTYFNFREDTNRVHAIPSSMTAVLAGTSFEQQLGKWESYFRRSDIYTSRPKLLLVPLNQNNIHWTLAVLGNPFDPSEQFLVHVDSQCTDFLTMSIETGDFMRSLTSAISGTAGNITINQGKQVQQQEDSHSCGPLVVFS
jgi:hypothetical protein